MREQVLKHSAVLWLLGAVLAASAAAAAVAFGGTPMMLILCASLVAVVISACALRWPTLAPCIVVVAAVYDRHIYFNYEVFQLSSLVLVLLLVAPAFFRAWVVEASRLPKFLSVGAVALVLGFILSTFSSPDSSLAIVGTVRWILVINMILGTAAMVARDRRLAGRLAWCLVMGGAIAATFAIAQRLGIYILIGPPYAEGVYNSTFGYYSNYANYVAMASVVGVGLVLHLQRSAGKWKFVAVVATAMSAYGAVSSLSRGAILCMGVGIGLVLVRQVSRPGRFIAASAGIGLAGGVVWLFTSEEFKEGLISRFLVAPGGDVVRRQMQSGGLGLLDETPLGIGFNNFQAFVASGRISADKALAHAHNSYIQMGLDSGWIGLIGFVVITMGACLAGLKGGDVALRLGSAAALAGCLIQISQDFFFFEPASMALFGVVLALSAARAPMGIQPPDEGQGLLFIPVGKGNQEPGLRFGRPLVALVASRSSSLVILAASVGHSWRPDPNAYSVFGQAQTQVVGR